MAAVDYFLKLEGIEGESSDSKHKNEIDIESWSWGETQSGSFAGGGGGGAGKVSMQDFHFVMRVNKSSPKLMEACASGEHIKKSGLALSEGRQGATGIFENYVLRLPGLLVPDRRLRRRGYRSE